MRQREAHENERGEGVENGMGKVSTKRPIGPAKNSSPENQTDSNVSKFTGSSQRKEVESTPERQVQNDTDQERVQQIGWSVRVGFRWRETTRPNWTVRERGKRAGRAVGGKTLSQHSGTRRRRRCRRRGHSRVCVLRGEEGRSAKVSSNPNGTAHGAGWHLDAGRDFGQLVPSNFLCVVGDIACGEISTWVAVT